MSKLTPLLGWTLALPAAWAAQAPPNPSAESSAALAVRVAQADGIDAGSGVAMPAVIDDSVPLPRSPIVRPSPDGDVVIAPASGDPFFLGFAAGAYYPPAGEVIDPLLSAGLRSLYDDGRPTQETYAFVMFEKRITQARLGQLESLGARVLGFHPHYCVRVALPPLSLDAVAALDFVRWIGLPRPWQKLHPALASAPGVLTGQRIDVYVDVYDSDSNPSSVPIATVAPTSARAGGVLESEPGDPVAIRWKSNGWQQRALESAGLEVTEYVDSIRAFRARLDPARVDELVALDCVQFIEPDLTPQLFHDESMPMISSDLARVYYDGGKNSAAVMGIADSGYHFFHYDLNDADAVGWDFTAGTGPYVDGCGHGSHVLGTIRGEGDVNPSYRGSARGLGWGPTGKLFVAKVFNDTCGWSGASLTGIMNVLHTPYSIGHTTTPRPHVINHSWGTSGGPYFGTEANARTIDNEVYNHLQLHIWAAGNSGPSASTIGLEPSSKNAFTVGAVVDFVDSGPVDPGAVAIFSSRGPCGDGRWKPNIAAPGDWITSVGNASSSGYASKSGTSMAAPHVTGVAAQLCDHYSWLRYAPHRLASLMMATAMTKDDQALVTPTDTHLDTYGAGRIEAYRAHWSTSQMQWTNSGWDQSSANWVYGDFTVGAGATRLLVCMTYHEPAASAGASKALVNDFDLYIDSPAGGIDPAGNTGEYVAQQSALDNTEIRIVNNPLAGAWRFKVWPENVPGTAHVSTTVVTIYGDTTPAGTLTVTASDPFVRPFEDVSITATVTNPSFMASAVFLDSTSSADVLQSSSTTLADGAVTDLMSNVQSGRDVLLGDILHGSARSATWVTRWYNEGVQPWKVQARSDNWVDQTQVVYVTVDGTEPGAVTNLASTTHTPNVWSNNPGIAYSWTAATDNLSGVDGYARTTTSAAAQPPAVKSLEETATTYAETLATGTWYLNLRSVDNCGNWDTQYASAGPFRIDTIAPTGPSSLSSTSHVVGVQSCATSVSVQWSAATDAHSGLAGYLGIWNTLATFDPTGATNIAAGDTSATMDIGSSSAARYFHLRAKDVAGNYGATQHLGPIYANANSVSTYCTAKTNSLGCAPTIASSGIPSVSSGNFTVTCANVLNNKSGLLFWGPAQAAVPFQGGWLCVAPPTVRTPGLSSGGSSSGQSCTGSYAFMFTSVYMSQSGIDPGDTVCAQWWMRDPGAASATGLSNAVQFTACQ